MPGNGQDRVGSLDADLGTEVDMRPDAAAGPDGGTIASILDDENQAPHPVVARGGRRIRSVVALEMQWAIVTVALAHELPIARHQLSQLHFRRSRRHGGR